MKYDYLVEKILYLERAENIKNFGDVVPHPIGDKVGALLTRLSDIELGETLVKHLDNVNADQKILDELSKTKKLLLEAQQENKRLRDIAYPRNASGE